MLVTGPLGGLSCGQDWSSCPDDGTDPPVLVSEVVEPNLAGGGQLTADECQDVCGYDAGDAILTCVRASEEEVLCVGLFLCTGRRPSGLRPEEERARSALEHLLGQAAWLEAASVDAFRVLRRELRAHRAPRRLLRAASRAAQDERRHARIARSIARRFGVVPPPLAVEPRALRSLEEMAVENAVEGCVRETWGALLALEQARHAADPVVRGAMQRVATDEIRHAELGWAVDTWLRPRLSRDARKRVQASAAAAVGDLIRQSARAVPTEARRLLGLPEAAQASTLIAALERSVWRPRGWA